MNLYTYQPSGKLSFSIYVIGFLFLLLGIPFLSALYSLLLWYIPFVVIHFIFTGGYAAVLALSLNKVLKWGKVRNKKFASYFALIATVFAVYFVWTSYITLLYIGLGPSSIKIYRIGEFFMTKNFFNIRDYLRFSLSPGIIADTMSYLYENGAWSIKSRKADGLFLAVIWFLEAITIIGIGWLGGTQQAEEPFSEESNTWFKKKQLPIFFKHPYNQEIFLEALKNGNSSVLKSLEFDNQDSKNYYQITTFTHSYEIVGYINVSNVSIKPDSKGKDVKTIRSLLKNIRVSLSDLEHVDLA